MFCFGRPAFQLQLEKALLIFRSQAIITCKHNHDLDTITDIIEVDKLIIVQESFVSVKDVLLYRMPCALILLAVASLLC